MTRSHDWCGERREPLLEPARGAALGRGLHVQHVVDALGHGAQIQIGSFTLQFLMNAIEDL